MFTSVTVTWARRSPLRRTMQKGHPGRQYRVTDTGCQSELVAVLTTLVEPSGRDSTIEPSAASATVATPSAASCSPKERETARRRIAASSFVLDGLAMPPVLHREALYPSGSAGEACGSRCLEGPLGGSAAVLISGCAGIRCAWCGARSKVIASSSARLVAWRCRKGRTCAGCRCAATTEISTSSSRLHG